MKRAWLVSLIVLAAVFALVGSVNADMQVFFRNNWGIYAHGQVGGSGNYIPAGTLIQMIWTPNNFSVPLPFGWADPAAPAGAGEMVVFSTFGPDEGGWGLSIVDLDGPVIYLDAVWGVALANGYIYGRIFDVALPGDGNHYYDSATVDVLEWGDLLLTELNVAATDGIAVNQTIAIPEPASLALFGLGFLSIVVLRMRRK